MSNKLNYFGPFEGDIGYAICARNMLKGIGDSGVNVCAIPDGKMRTKENYEFIKKYLPSPDETDQNAIALLHGPPRGYELAKVHGSKRYVYSVLESSKIPESWVNNLNDVDGAVTATKWGKTVYEDSGVKNVSVVPHGVDSLLYSPFNMPIDELNSEESFKFFAVGKYETRKGYDILLRAYTEEFAPDEKVLLVLNMHNPFVRDFNSFEALLSMNLKHYSNIEILRSGIPTSVMARLYASVDCFVSSTRGEGWGMPITEAMASALPVIATNWSGPTEYLTTKNSYPLKFSGLVPVPSKEMFLGSMADSVWAEPDFDELRSLLRHVFDNRDEAKGVGERAREDMKKLWTWKKAAHDMIKSVGLK